MMAELCSAAAANTQPMSTPTTPQWRTRRQCADPPRDCSTNGAGQVVYQPKTPYRDGTTHFVFEPIEFLARLARWFLGRAATW